MKKKSTFNKHRILIRPKIDFSKKKRITAYDIIADCLGFKHVRDNIYIDKKGEKFILTKYGFEPAESISLHTQLLYSNKKIFQLQGEKNEYKNEYDTLTARLDYVCSSHKQTLKQNKRLRKKNRSLKRKFENLTEIMIDLEEKLEKKYAQRKINNQEKQRLLKEKIVGQNREINNLKKRFEYAKTIDRNMKIIERNKKLILKRH